MKTIQLNLAALILSTLAASAATLTIQPGHPLPEFRRSLLWEAKTLPTDRDGYGTFLVGDFNHDGRLDAVVINGAYPDVTSDFNQAVVYLQNPDGSLSKKASYTLNLYYCLAMLSGDLNEDGHPDLLVQDSGNDLWLMVGKGDGTFQEPSPLGLAAPISPILADLNGDKHLDLVAGAAADGAVTVFLGRGDGTFKQSAVLATSVWPQAAPAPGAGQIMIGDVNGDGKLDLAVASPQQSGPSWTGNLDVCLGKGDGTFRDPITTPDAATWRGALRDFNGDGILDYVGDRYSPRQLEVWLGKGNGEFIQGQSASVPYSPIEVHPVDLNADGILDLIVTGETSTGSAPLSILLGKGDGTFRASQTWIPLPNTVVNWYGLQVVDFNGSGRPDVIVSATGPNGPDKAVGVVLAANPPARSDATSGFLLQAQGMGTAPLALEWSPDLIHWTSMSTNAHPQTVWPVLDSPTGEPQRFYRTRDP